MKKIGLFGGTFDPIHNGHLHIARAFADELDLDLVIFLPAGDPYHKETPTNSPARNRLAMVELAIADEPRFAASNCDIVREGATYTFDTVEIFRQQFPSAELWCLLGMDSLMTLHTWHRWQGLVKNTRIAVAARKGDGIAHIYSKRHNLTSALPIFAKFYTKAATLLLGSIKMLSLIFVLNDSIDKYILTLLLSGIILPLKSSLF